MNYEMQEFFVGENENLVKKFERNLIEN